LLKRLEAGFVDKDFTGNSSTRPAFASSFSAQFADVRTLLEISSPYASAPRTPRYQLTVPHRAGLLRGISLGLASKYSPRSPSKTDRPAGSPDRSAQRFIQNRHRFVHAKALPSLKHRNFVLDRAERRQSRTATALGWGEIRVIRSGWASSMALSSFGTPIVFRNPNLRVHST